MNENSAKNSHNRTKTISLIRSTGNFVISICTQTSYLRLNKLDFRPLLINCRKLKESTNVKGLHITISTCKNYVLK